MCKSCEALMINGVYCHEIGCPDSWKDYARNCRWCGEEFIPEDVNQVLCSEDCGISYNQ